MAQRRMFSKDIVHTDRFLEMPTSSQLLYFHLGIHADDDGFITPKLIMRMIGVAEDDLKVLIAKNFVIPFEDGVVVIKDWKINNEIKSDRYRESIYKSHKSQLSIQNGTYSLCIQPGDILDPQYSIGKDRLVKDSIGKYRLDNNKEKENYVKEKEIPEEFKAWVKTGGKVFSNKFGSLQKFIQSLKEEITDISLLYKEYSNIKER